MENFTEVEKYYLSEGILALIQKATDAKMLVWDTKTHRAIDSYIEKLQRLNRKICENMHE